MQAEVKAKDEQIIRWEADIMKKLDALDSDIQKLEKDLAQSKIRNEEEKKQWSNLPS